MDRRSFLTSLVAAPVLAAVAAACGDDGEENGGGGSIAHPTAPDELVIRVAHVGGFFGPGMLFASVPQLLVGGDGRVYQGGAQIEIFPGPLLPPVDVRTITEAGVQKLLDAARTAGLLADPAPGAYDAQLNVADAGATQLTIAAAGGRFVHEAEALGIAFDPDGRPGEELTEARQRLWAFVQYVSDLEASVGPANLGPVTRLTAARYRIQAREVGEDELAGFEPEPTEVPWPASDVRLADAAQCAITSDKATIAALVEANQLTFFVEDDRLYQVSAIAVLPGDAVC